MKTCPKCDELVDVFATRCPYCLSLLKRSRVGTLRAGSGPLSGFGSRAWNISWWVLGIVLTSSLLVVLLLPFVQSPHGASRRTQCRNNLKQIGLALHNYHDDYGAFPPAYVADKNGRPLYSWRVLILPYIDQEPLYKQFDLSQPWDSPTNLRLLDQIPLPLEGFRCPSDLEAKPNTTSYVAVFGPNCVFSGATPTRIRDITDGLSSTLMVGEITGKAIPWTKPDDVDITSHPTMGLPGGFSSRHEGGCHFLFGEGRVKFLSEDVSPKTLHDLFIRNDGHKIGAY